MFAAIFKLLPLIIGLCLLVYSFIIIYKADGMSKEYYDNHK